jgi:hypothetical protein
MSNDTNTPTKIPYLVLPVAFAALCVAVVFIVAIQAGPGVLVLLVGLTCALSFVLFRILKAVFVLMQNYAKDKYQHAEQMANKGVLVRGRGFPQYELKQAQIAAPVQNVPQLAPAKGIQFDSASMEANAINLLLYSCQLLGRDSKRIASNPECAAANIPGYNGRKWDAIVNKYLKLSYDIATVTGPIDNGGGAFVPPEIGTVGAFYDKLTLKKNGQILDDAVTALPEVARNR